MQHSDGQCEHTLRLPDSFLACCALSDLRFSFVTMSLAQVKTTVRVSPIIPASSSYLNSIPFQFFLPPALLSSLRLSRFLRVLSPLSSSLPSPHLFSATPVASLFFPLPMSLSLLLSSSPPLRLVIFSAHPLSSLWFLPRARFSLFSVCFFLAISPSLLAQDFIRSRPVSVAVSMFCDAFMLVAPQRP